MTRILALPTAVPLLVAGLLLAVPYRPVIHRVAGIGTSTAVFALGAVLLARTRDGSVLTGRIGGWPPGIAISLAVDTFAALMLVATSAVAIACLVFAAGSGDDRHPYLVPLVLLMTAGAYGAFLAADLFNLFVLIEVMLVPSYVLLTAGGGRERIRAGRIYVTVNLLASTIFLAGVGLLYGVSGTVGLAELAGAAVDSPTVALAAGVVLLALAIKAAVVPVHGWLPRSYPYAPPVVTAICSGVLTKVGVYAIVRIVAVVYDGAPGHGWLIAVIAAVTMVLGVLGAVGESGLRSVLSFHMVSQVGYILLGLALFSEVALAAAVYFMVQYILVKAALFLSAGAVLVNYGTDRLDRLGGLAVRHRLLALAFASAALSLAGMPPFSGFLAKFLIVRAAVIQGEYLVAMVAIVVGLGTLLSMIKIWDVAFWGEPLSGRADHHAASSGAGGSGPAGAPARISPTLTVPALTLVGISLLLGLAAEPLLDLADTAAAGLVDPSGYVRAVTGR